MSFTYVGYGPDGYTWRSSSGEVWLFFDIVDGILNSVLVRDHGNESVLLPEVDEEPDAFKARVLGFLKNVYGVDDATANQMVTGGAS